MYDITAIGEPVIDFERLFSDEKPVFRANAGGGSLNVLAAARMDGAKTAMLGCVGDDMFGRYLASVIGSMGIEASGIKTNPFKNTGIGFVSLADDGERDFVFYRDRISPVTYFTPDDRRLVRDTRVLHYTSVSMTGAPGREATRAAVIFAKSAGTPLSFDVNYRPAMWESAAEAKKVITMEVKRADVVKLDDAEALFVTGKSDIREAASAVLGMGPRMAAITLGKRGCYYAFSNGCGYCGTPAVNAVDTTGCGDAFTGVLLHSLMAGQSAFSPEAMSDGDMRRAIRRANAAGALCSLKKGSADCMPDRDAIDKAAAAIADPEEA